MVSGYHIGLCRTECNDGMQTLKHKARVRIPTLPSLVSPLLSSMGSPSIRAVMKTMSQQMGSIYGKSYIEPMYGMSQYMGKNQRVKSTFYVWACFHYCFSGEAMRSMLTNRSLNVSPEFCPLLTEPGEFCQVSSGVSHCILFWFWELMFLCIGSFSSYRQRGNSVFGSARFISVGILSSTLSFCIWQMRKTLPHFSGVYILESHGGC